MMSGTPDPGLRSTSDAGLENVTDPTPAEPVPPPPEMLAPGVLVPTFVLLIVVAFALFARGVGTVAGNELSKHQCVFTAVNAATLTGFQQARNPADYTPAGQVITLALMIGGTLFSLVGGGLAVTRITRLRFRDWTLAVTAVASVLLVAAIGAVAAKGPDRFAGAYQAISAFGNVGLYVGHLPAGDDARTLWLLMPLAVLGSLGLPALLDGAARLRGRGRHLSAHTRVVVCTSATVYLATAAVLFLLLAAEGTSPDGGSIVPWAAVTASREAVNARSAGFPFEFVSYLPAASSIVLMVAMVIGGAPGGTAGGLKVTTVAAVAGGVWDSLRGRPIRRTFGLAVAWLVAYVGIMLTATVALLMADPELRGDRLLYLAASALGNVGLSHDPVSPSTAGMYVLSLTMLAGRVLPVLVLWTIADRMGEVTEAIG